MGRVLRRVSAICMMILCFHPAAPDLNAGRLIATAESNLLEPLELARGTREFIRKGVPQGVFVPDGGWAVEEDKYVGSGREKSVLADHVLGQGNFDLEVKMTLNKVGANYSAIRFGAGRLVLGGDGGKIIFKGLPDAKNRVEICPLDERVNKDDEFQVRIRRRGTNLIVFIDGKRIHQQKGIGGRIGEIGVVAGDGPTLIETFRVSGDLQTSDRKVRINRDALKILDRDERITRSIEGGLDFLLDRAIADPAGVSPSRTEAIPGARALEAYAMIVAGLDINHPVVRSHLEYCSRSMPNHRRIYDLACWTFALDSAIAQEEQDALLMVPELTDAQLQKLARKHRKDLQIAADQILKAQNETGGWRYNTNSTDADTSVTQFASLAVGVFARRGIEISDKCWTGMINYSLSRQMPSGEEVNPVIILEPYREKKDLTFPRGGTSVESDEIEPRPLTAAETRTAWKRGFHYADKNPKSGSWNMSCAAVSSLQVAYMFGKGALTPEECQKVRDAIRDGVAWIEGEWEPHKNFYGMYSMEKVGDLGEIKTIGEHDWYLEMSDYLLNRQENEGKWGEGEADYHGQSDRLNTSLALLILKRASAFLTRGPRDVVIFTGGDSSDQEAQEEWILVPRLGTSVHMPSLVRTLRLRPKPKMLKLLEEIVASLPTWKRPLMVPYLALVEERVNSRGVRKIIERCHEQIRPSGFSDPEEMTGWYKTWHRAREIGDDELPEAGEELIGIAQAAAGDPVLRETAIRAALKLGLQSSAQLLLEDLSSEFRELRVLGYQGLRSLYSDLPPEFEVDAEEEVRKKQIIAIQGWLVKQ